VQAGGQVVDVKVSAVDAVQTAADAVDVPICIDTASHKALAAGLAVCPGKRHVKSVTDEESSLGGPCASERTCLCSDRIMHG